MPGRPESRFTDRSARPAWPFRAGLVGMLVLLLLAGCSNNPYPPTWDGQNVIYRYLPGDLRTLDPVKSYTVDEAYVVDLIYDCFYGYHPFKVRPYVLELVLGAEEPKREPKPVTEVVDGKPQQKQGELWTFRIKKGLRFQDDPCFPEGKGREITAADFIYAFRRLADPKNASPVLGFFEDKILGFRDYIAAARKDGKLDYAAKVEGLQLDPADPYVFRLLLNQAYPQLRYLMAMHFTSPVAPEAVAKYGKELARHPVGCGPYVVSEYTPKRRIVLDKNPNRPVQKYPSEGDPGDKEKGLLADAGKDIPLSDRVVFSFLRERIAAWNFFQQGYLDRYIVNQDNFSQVIAGQGQLSEPQRKKGVVLFTSATPNTRYFSFNMRDPVVGGYTPEKRKLRQAISLAIDSEEIINLVYEGNGSKAEFVVPPGIVGYDEKYVNPYRTNDLEKAKRLLAEAGYPNGIDQKTGDRLTIYYDNTATTPELRQFVAITKRQVERLGIRLDSRVSRETVWQDLVDTGKFQFIFYGWYADYPDAENFLFLFYGPNRAPGPNHSNYENPEYDRLFEQMRAMEDGPERERIIKRMRDIAVEDCPWVYAVHDVTLGLSYDWVKNTKPHGVANDTTKFWRVDIPTREARQRDWNHPNYWPTILSVLLLFAISVPAAAVVRQRRNRRVRETGGDA